MLTPLKRHKALQPVSREHHYGLLLSWKIREGFKRKIASERIKKYADWFWESHLQAHFDFEEKYIFPVLPKDHKLIKRAMREHGRLKSLFKSKVNVEQNLSLLEEEVIAHIRFEERILFQEIQSKATEDELAKIAEAHDVIVAVAWEDEFWVDK